MFYNRVNPAEIQRYVMACPGNVHPKLWNTALENNPDPDTLAPSPAAGFDGLYKRVKVQEHEIEGQRERLRDTEKFITEVIEKRSLETAIKLEEYKRQSNQLGQRLLQLAARVELLRARGMPTQPDEDMWRQRLLSLQAELQKPNQFKGRLNELASRVRMHQETYASAMTVAKEALSEQDAQQVAQFLADQRRGLAHLTEILKTDTRNLGVMLAYMNEPPKRM
jgi:nuclear pore complex protein Nup54